jgi:Holliday junction resolvase RusA-like endonuclease
VAKKLDVSKGRIETGQASEQVQLGLLPEAAPLRAASKPFVVFEVPGEPRAWERPGATIRWAHGRPFIHWYTRTEEARWREQIAWVAKVAMRGRKPTSEPVALLVHAFLPIPASWPWRRKQAARAGAVLPATKPDWDNCGGKILDAIKDIVWIDDALVIDGRVIKRYSDRPALRVEVREMLPPK